MTKKVKWSFLILIWSVVVIQLFVNQQQKKSNALAVTAFASLNEEVEETVSGYGYFGEMELSDPVKKEMLQKMAEKLNLESPYKIVESKRDLIQRWSLEKTDVKENVKIEFITAYGTEGNEQQYILVNSTKKIVDAKEDSMYELVEQLYKEIGIQGKVTVEQTMSQSGNQLDKIQEYAAYYFEPLHAKQVDEICENGIYTIYGYTPNETTYFLQNKKKVNVQLVLFYDTDQNKTYVKLGLPMVNSPY